MWVANESGVSNRVEAKMALRAEFLLLHSELNDFLFAQIGEEERGDALTVLSALTRLGIDPWAEGARLSGLSRAVAAKALVPMIASFPKNNRTSSDVLKLAERLAALLPPRAPDHPTGVVANGFWRPVRLPVLCFVGLGLLLLLLAIAASGLLPG
jgi:hypothetical protein